MEQDTPGQPTPAIKESTTAVYRKGQISVIVKVVIAVLSLLQLASVPTIGYLVGKWDAMQELVGGLRERTKVLETRMDSGDKVMERIDAKLDRLLQERRP